MKKVLAIIAMSICASAWAFGSLVGEQVNGSVKYCKYSNGVIITVNSYELCPITIN